MEPQETTAPQLDTLTAGELRKRLKTLPKDTPIVLHLARIGKDDREYCFDQIFSIVPPHGGRSAELWACTRDRVDLITGKPYKAVK